MRLKTGIFDFIYKATLLIRDGVLLSAVDLEIQYFYDLPNLILLIYIDG